MLREFSRTKRRIAGPLLKALPGTVANRVRTLGGKYQIKSATVVTIPEGWSLVTREGGRYCAIVGERELGVEMVSEATIGASGVHHDIGSKISPPLGAWIIEITYYTRYWMTIYNVVQDQVPSKISLN